jgi:hypothetical protein
MNRRRMFAMSFALIVVLSISVPVARASEWDQQTKLVFSEAVEVPGRVLPPGSYWFVLANDDFDRDIVQIFSSDRSTLYAMVQTVPAERQQPSDKTTLTLAERPSGRPEALLTWFYPGETTGHEFIYSAREEKELSRDVRQNVPAESLGYAGEN